MTTLQKRTSSTLLTFMIEWRVLPSKSNFYTYVLTKWKQLGNQWATTYLTLPLLQPFPVSTTHRELGLRYLLNLEVTNISVMHVFLTFNAQALYKREKLSIFAERTSTNASKWKMTNAWTWMSRSQGSSARLLSILKLLLMKDLS